jgi:RNA polymerase sigma factor (sigma-70 family)
MVEMSDKPDAQLLREYAEDTNEAAFCELVARHTDLVYAAALRQVDSDDLARDVAQSVFTDLARKARSLAAEQAGRPSLAGWLYRGTRFAALGQLRADRRRQAHERQVMDQLDSTPDAPAGWDRFGPFLDAAMSDLPQEDREALLLRFFQNRDFRAIGASLGVSDDAAQKRVSRAVDKLRAQFARRGLTTTALALSAALSANAVTVAPDGLSAALSSAALSSASLATAATVAAAGTAALTTMHKALMAAAFAVLAGAGIFQAHQVVRLREEVRTLQQQQIPLAGQIRQLQHERDDAANRLAAAKDEIARLKSQQSAAELLRLRGEIGLLQRQLAVLSANAAPPGIGKLLKDPAMRDYMYRTIMNENRARFGSLFKELKLTPEQTEKVVQSVGDLFLKNADTWYGTPQGTMSAAEIAQTKDEQQAELKNTLLPLLGQSGVDRFIEVLHGFPAEATVALLNGQVGANQLSDDQSDRLSKLVNAEPFDLTRGISGDWDPAFWGSQDDIDNHLAQVAECNQRILQQAGSFLASDQLAALNTVLTNSVNERIVQATAFIGKP